MVVVDTNVLIYAANADAPEHLRCRTLVEELRRGRTPWFTTWSVLYEFLRVVTHPRVLPNPWNASQGWNFIDALLASPSHSLLLETQRHAAVASEILPAVAGLAGNVMHDFHTAVLMRENGISRVYTRDMDFRRFPGIDVLDPLRPE
jgi:uncharacterized protein